MYVGAYNVLILTDVTLLIYDKKQLRNVNWDHPVKIQLDQPTDLSRYMYILYTHT